MKSELFKRIERVIIDYINDNLTNVRTGYTNTYRIKWTDKLSGNIDLEIKQNRHYKHIVKYVHNGELVNGEYSIIISLTKNRKSIDSIALDTDEPRPNTQVLFTQSQLTDENLPMLMRLLRGLENIYFVNEKNVIV